MFAIANYFGAVTLIARQWELEKTTGQEVCMEN